MSTINLFNSYLKADIMHLSDYEINFFLFILETNWISPDKKVKYFNLKPSGTNEWHGLWKNGQNLKSISSILVYK